MERKEYLLAIFKVIREIRESRGETTWSMSTKLKYSDHSSYSKMERGNGNSIDLFRLMEICEILDTNLIEVCTKAGVPIFGKNNIDPTSHIFNNTSITAQFHIKELPTHRK